MLILLVALLEIVLLILATVFFAFFMVPLFFYGAPFLPSYRRQKRQILEPLFKLARQAPGQKFVDLGSGDGRVVIEFAKQGFESWGVEFNPALAWWSRLAIKRLGLKNAHIIKKSFWKIDLNSFDIVYIYQLTSINVLLADKFKKELKTGAIIISAGFFLPNFELIKKEGIFGVYRN
ncbi:MAG: methyltransferase domain-containing protein [Candidatus Sungbacteria bacterium]|uniref:Methyltransferase domain-containing protein n=1 Tax=Candidatus Sungiibacteriota bacterium TaxID=2750080 RepID=A0A9D6HTT0_9BACT|nr:methyltransferase domain-containing protein [Candidatus Sungbacteria bacterium]